MFMKPEDTLQLMKSRRSIRSFKKDQIPDEHVKLIIEAARWCQSASNKQPWRFVIVKNKEKIEALGKCATYGNFITQAPVILAIIADQKLAPKWFIHDSSMASHQACLMAWSLGIGTCWIGSMDREKAASALGLSKNEFLTTILPLGYPSTIPDPPSRKSLDRIMTIMD